MTNKDWRGVPPFEPRPGDGYAYMQLFAYIRDRIHDGTYKPGYRFRAERDLAFDYRVSVGTVRKAFDVLRRDGLAKTIPSSGSFVPSEEEQARFTSVDKPPAAAAHVPAPPTFAPVPAPAPVRRGKSRNFEDIALDIIDRITEGDLQVGQPLPTPDEICRTYGVKAGMAARAIAYLKFRGFAAAGGFDGEPVVRDPQPAQYPIDLDDNI